MFHILDRSAPDVDSASFGQMRQRPLFWNKVRRYAEAYAEAEAEPEPEAEAEAEAYPYADAEPEVEFEPSLFRRRSPVAEILRRRAVRAGQMMIREPVETVLMRREAEAEAEAEPEAEPDAEPDAEQTWAWDFLQARAAEPEPEAEPEPAPEAAPEADETWAMEFLQARAAEPEAEAVAEAHANPYAEPSGEEIVDNVKRLVGVLERKWAESSGDFKGCEC